MIAASHGHGLSIENYLAHVNSLRRDPGTPANSDPEARALTTILLRQQGLTLTPNDIHIFSTGTAGLLDMLVHAFRARLLGDTWVLAPAGYETSDEPHAAVYHDLDDALNDLHLADDNEPTVLYVPLVNKLTGQVLTRDLAHRVAHAVLQHNRDTPTQPVYVLTDNSGIGTYHSSQTATEAQPITTVTGHDLGDDTLGQMSDWTISTITPDVTYGYPTCHITFAVTHNPRLRAALRPASNSCGYTSTSPIDELIAAATLCLVPQQWIEHGNQRAAHNLRRLRQALARINHHHGFDAVTASAHTAGGRHTSLQLHPRIFPMPPHETVTELIRSIRDHGPGQPNGRPPQSNRLFAWNYPNSEISNARFTIRVNLVMPEDQLEIFVSRLEQAIHAWPRAESA
jgi:hypothetical protein